MASGFHKLDTGKQGGEVSEINMATHLFITKAKIKVKSLRHHAN
jgi:hypothetical protein